MKKTIPMAITWFMALMLVFSLNSWGQEQIIYTVGFEADEEFTAATVYNNTTIKYDGPAAQQWGTYYGTASTTGAISGSQSMQMRWYTSAVDNLGYTFTDFDLNNVTKVDFLASSTNDVNVNVSYSTDGGNTFIGDEIILITDTDTYTYEISETGEFDNVRIKFTVSLPDPIPGGTSRLYIDDVVIYGIVEEPLPFTVVDIIVESDVHTTLAKAVTDAELVDALSGDGPFTVFAPTDDAFDALPDGLLDDLLADPTGLLTDILLYHVVGAFALSTDLEDGQEITTLLGEDVIVTFTNGSVFINDAEVILADLEADNGVVHVIDAVLVPTYDIQITENDTHGSILTDGAGNTLYFFSLDADGSSACVGGCLDNWPLFYDENLYLSAGLDPDDFDSIDRGEGVMQTTYKGWPLYYFVNDNEAGDVNGEGIINKWFVAKPDYTVMLTDNQLVGADGLNYTGDYTEGDEIIQYLVDAYGNTLYTWVNDRNNRNRFTAADFSNNAAWPIFDAEGMIVPSTLNADDFGVIDVYGESQLTFKGWPLYNFGQDNIRGETKGVSLPEPGIWPVPVPDMMEAPAYTVVDIVVSSPDHQTLTAALTAAELVETLQGEGPFTVFAPTDDAFDALPDGLLDDLLADPSGALTDILLYHVMGAFALSTDLGDGDVITTLLGEDIVVTITTDGTIFINDAEVIMADLVADNGVVHVIDAVLVPEEEMDEVTCAFSQGYWFAKPQTVWPYDVEVGGLTFTQEEGASFWPPNTNTRRAFTQYSAIYLSGVTVSLFPELEDAMETIDNYFANHYPAPAGIQINRAAGFIGDWIDENHCDDQVTPEPEFARAQIIHNAADLAAASVDVFVNGEIFEADFFFRTATPFLDVPAGVELKIDIAPAGAGIENSVFDITVEFDADETYIIVANGIVSEEGYDPIEPFTVYPFAPARETGVNEDETDLLVFHGSTDAPEVSVWPMGGESALFTFEYGEFAGYLGLPTDDYVIEIRTADGETTVVAYVAPLATLELEGAALTVVASGFLNPANNSDGPAFGLFAATAAGGDLIPLPVYEEEPTTVVDIIVGSEIHTTLAAAVTAAGLVETLQGEGPFTVFAPTDDAFAALTEGLLDDLLADPSGTLTDILLYHVVGAFALSTDLEDGDVITTLLGKDVVVTISAEGVFINDAQVILADLVADNGVVHVIDAVLVPEEEEEEEEEPEVVTCAFSQGYWFAHPQTVWPYDVELGGMTFTQSEGKAFWPPNTPARRAFTQYSAIYLSGVTVNEFPELEKAMEVIDDYFTNVYPAAAGQVVNRAAGRIGNWIDRNHCINNESILTSIVKTNPVRVFPNPFRTRVSMQFSIEESSPVKLEVYNLVGERIAVLFDGYVNASDIHSVTMEADNLPNGVYFYRLKTGNQTYLDKIILAR